jgi:hypothetical protein
MEADAEKSFLQKFCLPFLLSAQNADGGWGFGPKLESRVESTCWALQGLGNFSTADIQAALARGVGYLRTAQLGDGSWPFTPAEKSGCWVTSLSCWTMRDFADVVGAGLRWICDDWPSDTTLWRRLLAKFSTQTPVHAINNSYRGWSWTPGTSSWVEPTSFALIALDQVSHHQLPAEAKQRRALAEALLYDRMCPEGGWNCGNSRVYGVAADPLVVPTAWALIALRQHRTRRENVMGLEWLERSAVHIQSAGSLALAKICLETYGRDWPADAPVLPDLYERNGFLESVQVTSWTLLALSPRERWLTPAFREKT